MRRRKHTADLSMMADINVTSMVDVAFTLLIIFIITAPIMQGGIEVAVPKADVEPLTSQDKPLFITVTADGTIYLENTVVTVEALEAGLAQILGVGEIERVYLRGDSLAPFGPIVKAMASANNAGIAWGVVATPYQGPPGGQ